MSGCVINELNSKMSLGRIAPSEKYFRVPEVERYDLKCIKEQNQKDMTGYSQALSEYCRKIQSIHWLNLSRKYVAISAFHHTQL